LYTSGNSVFYEYQASKMLGRDISFSEYLMKERVFPYVYDVLYISMS
jgi:hypothetical protein